MLLQTLVVIAAILILSASIFVETLVSAKAGLHQAMLARTRTATVDASVSFVHWAQTNVASYGTGNASAWPGQAVPLQDKNLCPATVSPATPPPCPFVAFDSWQVRGSTSTGGAGASPPPGSPVAQNLAPTVNEQRLAATITVRITDPSGSTTFADRTREITARLFDEPPYVVITGARDIASEAGSIHAGEGDTAGSAQRGLPDGPGYATPDPQLPASHTDTRIETSVDCLNRPGFDPHSDGEPAASGEIDYRFHPYGNQDWAYESACVPFDGNPTPPAQLPGYVPPNGSTYGVYPGAGPGTAWDPGTEDAQSFPR